jgi:hypothetical protein
VLQSAFDRQATHVLSEGLPSAVVLQKGVAGLREQSQPLGPVAAPASPFASVAPEFEPSATGAFGGASEMGLVSSAPSLATIFEGAGVGVGFSVAAAVWGADAGEASGPPRGRTDGTHPRKQGLQRECRQWLLPNRSDVSYAPHAAAEGISEQADTVARARR